MGRFRIFRQLLAVFVVAGLGLAPLAAGAVAARPATVIGMADEMPCCPPSPTPYDCQKCPLIGLCVTGCLHCGPIAPVISLLARDLDRNDRPDIDNTKDGLVYSPVSPPPRSLSLPV